MWKNYQGLAVGLLSILLGACAKEKRLFEKLDAQEAGIGFENKLAPTEDFNIIDYLYFYNGGGVALGDINNDGLPDIFFSGNQVANRLYLNKGKLTFEDITEKGGVNGNSTWNTGSIMGDVNGDGLLDIYVCAVVGLKNLSGHNELYINNGDLTFSERSAEFGLDFESYSSSAAFLDYDLDGDLDMYLLNHAIHTSGSFGHANLRNKRTYETGDKLLRNDGGKFTDVSEAAKIYGGINGYGLGLAISDFNQDGYPDIYVGNDFHEDDYLYINNRDGTFAEQGKNAFTCTSKFSMGNDIADINHDGLPDIITLDMLSPEDEVVKRSEGDEDIKILRLRTTKYGYNYQFTRNTLQINQGNGTFAEAALLGNVAATDWSWSPLFSDFDQDGNQDLFISNGIPRRPNDLDYIKYVSSDQVVNVIGTTKLVDEKALSMMPSGKVRNFVFRGSGEVQFEDKSSAWLPDEATCSTASAWADLDQDGDLDIVVNNVDDKPGLYINQASKSSDFLKLRLNFSPQNPFGIGTRVYCYQDGKLQFREMYSARGFQSSSEPIVHFGFPEGSSIDSIKIVWPNGTVKKLAGVKTNQMMTVSPAQGVVASNPALRPSGVKMFEWVNPADLGLTFAHREDNYTDFDRLKLLPYQQSDRGPATAIGDLNNDGLADVFFGGSKQIAAQIFLQSQSGFTSALMAEILRDSIKEDVDAVIADFNGDQKSDLFIGSGGADFYNRSAPLLDSYYESSPAGFNRSEIADYYENTSTIVTADFDGDMDLDVFVGNQSVSNNFGKIPRSYLLVNTKGKLSPVQKDLFDNLGMVTDAVWDDVDKDGQPDLVVVGEWMQPVFLRNDKGQFTKADLANDDLHGLWQSVSPFDVDNDGDTDYVVGNWGLNSKFKASVSDPMKMYYSDFDDNGQSETIVVVKRERGYFPLDGFDMIASQIPSLRKKYTSYAAFAGQKMEDIFSNDQLKKADLLEVHELRSGYLKNEGGKFGFVPFPLELQMAPVMAQLKHDFDADGKDELMLAGNYFGVQPFHGRYGSFSGAVLRSGGDIVSGHNAGLRFMNRSVRDLHVVPHGDSRYLIATVNNDSVQVYKFRKQ